MTPPLLKARGKRHWLFVPLRDLVRGRERVLLRVAAGGLYLLLAAAVWWLLPLPPPRATLPADSLVLGLSPDGRLLATRQGAGVTFWDVSTGRSVGGLQGEWTDLPAGRAPATSWAFTFSPDSRWLATVARGRLRLWEVPAGRERAVVPVSTDKDFRPDPVFSVDGRWLAFRAEGPDRAHEIKVWDLGQGRERVTLSWRTRACSLFAASTVGLLAPAGGPGPLPAASVAIPRWLRVGSPVISPDGNTLAFETWEAMPGRVPEGRIHLWDLGTGREGPSVDDHPGPTRLLAFSPDGRTLATGERNRWGWFGTHEVKLWDLVGKKVRGTWQVPGGVWMLRFSADGTRLLVGHARGADDSQLHWDHSSIDPAAPGPVEAIPFSAVLSPDGRLAAEALVARNEPITIFELPGLHERAELRLPRAGERLFPREFTPDGQQLAVEATWPDEPSSGPGVDWLGRLFGRTTAALPGSHSPQSGELYFYQTDTGRLQATLPVVFPFEIWFAPDGKTLVLEAAGRKPTLWDMPVRRPWGRIVVGWALLAGYFAVVWQWLRGPRNRPPAAEPSPQSQSGGMGCPSLG
jgi:WD40 repeat protein